MLINNKYKIIESIGSGSFGSIYKGENVRTKDFVAIKIEPIRNQTKMLKNESIIYQYLKDVEGIPQVKWFGKDDINYYMVISLLGESLQSLKTKYGVFSLKLTLQIGIQVLQLIQTIHNKGLLHRDIKPDNFLLGMNENNKQLYVIDFGFCKSYLIDDRHIQIKRTNNLIGSMSYASINAHCFYEQSRRDDLESLGYMLIYFITGKLEWQDIGDCNSFEEQNVTVCLMKERIFTNKHIHPILLDYMKYVKNLFFDETPDYLTLIEGFKSEIDKK
jgi:casein kinase I family protein HRR25